MRVSLPPHIPAHHHWSVAIWDVTADELEQRGFTIGRDVDDLDAFQFVEVEDSEIGDVLLIHHEQAPYGFDVKVRADVLTSDALVAISRNFGISPADLIWVAPYSRYPGPMGELLSDDELSIARRDQAAGS